MDFEWDPAKSAATYQSRGFDFAYASGIFASGWVAVEDIRTDYGETRMKAIGQIGADILVGVYTVRGTTLRIISARRANKKGTNSMAITRMTAEQIAAMGGRVDRVRLDPPRKTTFIGR